MKKKKNNKQKEKESEEERTRAYFEGYAFGNPFEEPKAKAKGIPMQFCEKAVLVCVVNMCYCVKNKT